MVYVHAVKIGEVQSASFGEVSVINAVTDVVGQLLFSVATVK